MNFLVLSVSLLLPFCGPLLSSASVEQEKVKPTSSRIQYVSEEEDQTRNNFYGVPINTDRYGGLPNSYDGLMTTRGILMNPFPGVDGNSRDDSGDDIYRSNPGFSWINGPAETRNRSLNPDTEEQDETPNGVFNNPNRRLLNLLPPLFSSNGNNGNGMLPSLFAYLGNGGNAAQPNMFSVFGNNRNPAYGGPVQPGYGAPAQPGYGGTVQPGYGAPAQPGYGTPTQPGYGNQYPPMGIYDPNFRLQPGAYPTRNWYPSGGTAGNGMGQRQPNVGAYGPSYGNGYGAYPGSFRNYQPRYQPSDGMSSSSYRGSPPRTYGPPQYGSDRYPDPVFPGQGYEYGKYKDSGKSNGDKFDDDFGGKKSSPYSHSSTSKSSSKRERSKDYDGYRGREYDGYRGKDYDAPYREADYP